MYKEILSPMANRKQKLTLHLFTLVSQIFSRTGALPTLFLILFLVYMAQGLSCVDVWAEEKSNPYAIETEGKSPWHISADEITYDLKKKQGQAIGNASIRHLEKTLKADQITFDAQSMEAFAQGNVSLKVGEDTLTATSVEINLDKEKGVLHDSQVFLGESRFYIKGKKIEKTDYFTYAVEDATVTSCDGEDPDWKITGKKLDVTLDEYGVVKHGKLWVKDIPVFYTPFFMFPVKLDRQSGLLIPEFGVSKRKGFMLEQPVYWAINPSSDATFYEHFMAERGHKIGLEYRYVRDPQSKGTFQFDYLNDRKIDDGSATLSDQWGYAHDDFSRPNSSRYWFRAKQNQALPGDFFGKLDLDIVSDQDYLIEFKDGYTGFNTTRSDFQNEFSRMIDAYEDPVRVNQLNINKKGLQYNWNTSLRWYDNVIARKYLDEDKTLQKLPQIQFGLLRQQITRLPLFFGLDSDYSYFYSEAGTNGHRLDIHPTVFFPVFSNSYFNSESYVGFRETIWQITGFEDSPLESEKMKSHLRHMADFHVNFYSELNKVYDIQKPSVSAVKHVIYPEIRYTYIPQVNQEEFPSFDNLEDGINRIDETNEITFYLAQFLTAKTLSKDAMDRGENPESKPSVKYRRILRFVLKQTYDIREARSDSSDDFRNGKEKQPFLPLEAEFEMIPLDYFSISADTQWNYYDHALVEKNAALTVWNHRGDQLGITYRFTKKELESIDTNAVVHFTPRLKTIAGFERSLLENETIETRLGFLYDRDCWSFETTFIDKQEDRKYQFVFNLYGLGEVGTR